MSPRARQLPGIAKLRNRDLGSLTVTVLPIRSPEGPPLQLAPPCDPFFVADDRQSIPLLVRAPQTGLATAAVELARASAGKPYPHFTLSPSHFRPYLALAFCGWTPR